jgi:iron complex outermembrane recepter protein
VGVKGEFATHWTYDAFMQTSKVIYQQQEANYFSSARLANALDVVNVNGQAVCRVAQAGTDPACVPYNVFAIGGVTPAQLAYLQIPGLRTGSTQQAIQGASIGADLDPYGIRLPTAKNGVGVSFGFERRVDRLDLSTDAATQSGDLSGSGGPTPGLSGKTEVKEFFTEVRAPLIEDKTFAHLLQISASYRNSDNASGPKTNTYGFNIDYAPIKGIKARATYQKAVRSPDVIDLFTARGLNLYDNDEDPCAGETPTATLAQCQRTGVTAAQYGRIQDSPAGQYNFLQGGNPNLSPERANSYTAGFVFTPSANFSASIDYFDIKIRDTISNVNPVTTLNNCLATGDPRFCSQITRDRLGTLWLLDEARIIGTNVNIGSTRTSGFDLALNYSLKLGAGGGRLVMSNVGTYLRSLNTEEIKDLGSYECVGLYGNTCGAPNPRVRNKARVTWISPFNVDLSFTWRYFKKVDLDTGASALAVERTLGDRNYFDLAATWNATKKITIGAGINNLLDKDPPLSSQVGTGVGNGNTYPGVYDALGRRIFVNASVKF